MDIQNGMERKGESNYKRKVSKSDLVLRVLALLFTLVAAIVLGVNKQTKVVPLKILESFPPVNVPVSAKWHYQSAFVYHLAVNAIACAYAAISLVLSILNKGGKLGMMILVLDLMMVALLFSGNGATAAVGVIGYKGNSHLQWKKVCNVFDKFCGQVAASIALSLLGALVFLLLVTFSALRRH